MNIKNPESHQIKIDEKPYKNILIYYIGYMTVKSFSYIKIISINLLYFYIDKINRYIEESNVNKYLVLVLTNKRKDILKKYEEI